MSGEPITMSVLGGSSELFISLGIAVIVTDDQQFPRV